MKVKISRYLFALVAAVGLATACAPAEAQVVVKVGHQPYHHHYHHHHYYHHHYNR